MIARILGRSALVALASLALAGCSSTDSGGNAPLGNWGSATASLVTHDSTAHLLIASGDCFGAFADIAQPIPIGSFSLTGTFTQLTGVAPGSIQYAAQYSGTASSTAITITITLPSQGQQLGPFTLTYGVVKSWTACLFP
jgi:hypothetical protein